MYSQYPYGYRPGPYDAPQYDSAPYAAYYPQQAHQPAPPSTTRPAAASAHPQQRLSIRDPKTGAVVPIVTPQQVEKAVASYHKQRPVRHTYADTVARHVFCLILACSSEHPD